MRQAKRIAGSVLASLLALGIGSGVAASASADPGPAGADPGGSTSDTIPSRNQIDQAKFDAQARRASVDHIQALLADADTRLHVLESQAGQAVEGYDEAAAQAATAGKAAADALVGLQATQEETTSADGRLGTFAEYTYREGPDLTRVTAILHATNLRELTDRERLMRSMARLQAEALVAAQNAERTATGWRAAAAAAEDKQRAAERLALAARDKARGAAAAEQADVARIGAQRETLLAQLAAAEGVAVALERERQQGLADQAARAAAAAREVAARAAAASAAAADVSARNVGGAGANGGISARGGGAAAGAAAGGGGTKDWGLLPSAAGAVRTMLGYLYAQLGKPYVWGGAGPDVFDCSGLAMRGLEAAGWNFPHPAQWQYLEMRSLSYSELSPGDLVFWAEDDSNPHTIYHEAIYIGGDRIIQAPRPGGVVEIQSLWVNGTPAFYGRP